MQYKVEQIGAVFSTKAIQDFERLLSQRDQEGYTFHTAFPVTKSGCLGNQGETTYLAIFVRK